MVKFVLSVNEFFLIELLDSVRDEFRFKNSFRCDDWWVSGADV